MEERRTRTRFWCTRQNYAPGACLVVGNKYQRLQRVYSAPSVPLHPWSEIVPITPKLSLKVITRTSFFSRSLLDNILKFLLNFETFKFRDDFWKFPLFREMDFFQQMKSKPDLQWTKNFPDKGPIFMPPWFSADKDCRGNFLLSGESCMTRDISETPLFNSRMLRKPNRLSLNDCPFEQ